MDAAPVERAALYAEAERLLAAVAMAQENGEADEVTAWELATVERKLNQEFDACGTDEQNWLSVVLIHLGHLEVQRRKARPVGQRGAL